jgi:hypothetical protein
LQLIAELIEQLPSRISPQAELNLVHNLTFANRTIKGFRQALTRPMPGLQAPFVHRLKGERRAEMQKVKRVVIASALGIIFGFVSWAICKFGMGHTQPVSIDLVIILFNGLLGFTIGISSLRWHWAVHGLILGGMFGIVLGFVAAGTGSQFIWPFIFGLIYGFLIELITTLAFKVGVVS